MFCNVDLSTKVQSKCVCFFWIAFLVARTVGPFLTIGDLDSPYPWSNLLALPGVVLILNNLQFDDETGAGNP